jgi:hypothetical protein
VALLSIWNFNEITFNNLRFRLNFFLAQMFGENLRDLPADRGAADRGSSSENPRHRHIERQHVPQRVRGRAD